MNIRGAMSIPMSEDAEEIASDLTEKRGPPTHDLGHDASVSRG